MPVITLTSDWNSSDYYIAAIKGRLYVSGARDIFDISHNIKSYNTSQAAFVIRNSFIHFPEGSVHLILVNSEMTSKSPFLLVKGKGHYFIGADNGIFSQILAGKPEKVIQLMPLEEDNEQSFPGLSTFTAAAIHIINGNDIHLLGKETVGFQEKIPLRPTLEENSLSGSIIYIDSYRNAITNISRELFEKIKNERQFEILVQSRHYRINKISRNYNDEEAGELLAIFNLAGLLEIAINSGNAADLLNLETGSSIRIDFQNK